MCLTFIQLEKDIYKLRLIVMIILAYLDVLLVWFYTPESLKEDIETTLGFLRFLGWTINLAKSLFDP